MEEKTYRIEKCDGKVQWDEFILEHGGHPMQLWGWGDIRSELGWQVDRIFIIENDLQIGAAQLLVKRLVRPFGLCVYIPRGPLVVGDTSGVYEQLISYVKASYHGVALIVEPMGDVEPIGGGWQESDNHALPPRTLVFDLSKADGVLLAEMDSTTRDHIRSAGQANLHIKKIGNPTDIAACYKLYRDAAGKRGQKIYKERYFQNLYDKMGDFSTLFGAYVEEELVSFIWLLTSESVAVELYSGDSKKGSELSAIYGLRWEAIRRIKQWGIETYDIGGIKAGNEPDQKKGFGTTIVDSGTFNLPLSPMYNLWSRASRNRSSFAK